MAQVPDSDLQSSVVPESDLPVPASDLPSPTRAPKEPSPVVEFAKRTMDLSPYGMMQKAGSAINEAVTKFAYDTGGKVTDYATKQGLSPENAAKIGYSTNVLIQAIPALAGGFGTGKAAGPAMESGAKSLLQRVIKPPLSELENGSAYKAIDTILEKGVPISASGVAKLRAEVDELNKEVAQIIRTSPEWVDKNAVYQPIKEVLERFKRMPGWGGKGGNEQTILNVWRDFKNNPLISPREGIPVQIAQEFKQGAQASVASKSGFGSQTTAAELEAEKALSRGLREEVSRVAPQAAPKNARESELLNAVDTLERSTMLKGNRDFIGFGWAVHDPLAFTAYVAGKYGLGPLARIMYKGSEAVPSAVAGSGIAVGNELSRNINERVSQ